MPTIDALVEAVRVCGGAVLHLGPDRIPAFEAGGELAELGGEPFAALALERALLEGLDTQSRAHLTTAHEAEAWLTTQGGQRVAARIFRSAAGLGARLRVVGASARPLESLGCPEIVRKLCERPSGLVVIAGRRGAGKTTLVASMMEWINQSRAARILTIERPIETFVAEARSQIFQREIGVDASSFAAALRDAALEDLDAVVVSELATADAAEAAFDLASGGALVLAIVPAIGAVAAIRELLTLFGPDDLARASHVLGEALAGVVAVELFARADGLGYAGAHEVLLGSAALATMIRDDRLDEIAALIEAGGAAGMQSFDTAFARLCADGAIRVDQASARARDRAAFERALPGR